MKKLLVVLTMSCLISLPVPAIEEQVAEYPNIEENTIESVTYEDSSELNQIDTTEPESIENSVEPVTAPYKTPNSKKNLIKKFLVAMLCVAGTSVFLYLVLSLYNKLRNGAVTNSAIPTEGEKPLIKPGNLTEAVKTFIEKTNFNE